MSLASRLFTVMFTNEAKAAEDMEQDHQTERYTKMTSLAKATDSASQVASLQAALSTERRERESGEKELKETRELLSRLEGAMEQQAKVAAIDQAHLAALEGALAKQKEKVGTSFVEEDPEPRVQRLQTDLEEERLRREQAENQLDEMRKLLSKLEETIQEQAKVTQLDQEQQDKMAVIVEAWSDERKRASGLQATIDEMELKLLAEAEKVSSTQALLSQQSQEIQELQERLIAKDNKVCELQRSLQDELATMQAANDQLIDKERVILDLRRRLSESEQAGGSAGLPPPKSPRSRGYPPSNSCNAPVGGGVQKQLGSPMQMNSYTVPAVSSSSAPPLAVHLAHATEPLALADCSSPLPAPPNGSGARSPRGPVAEKSLSRSSQMKVDLGRVGARPSFSSGLHSPRHREHSKEPPSRDHLEHEVWPKIALPVRGASSGNLAAQAAAYAHSEFEIATTTATYHAGAGGTTTHSVPSTVAPSLISSVTHVNGLELPPANMGLKSRQNSEQTCPSFRSAAVPVATPAAPMAPLAEKVQRAVPTEALSPQPAGAPKRTMARQRLYVAFQQGQPNGESSAINRRLNTAARTFS